MGETVVFWETYEHSGVELWAGVWNNDLWYSLTGEDSLHVFNHSWWSSLCQVSIEKSNLQPVVLVTFLLRKIHSDVLPRVVRRLCRLQNRWLQVLPSPPGRTFALCLSAIWTHKRLASNLVRLSGVGLLLVHMMKHQQTPLFPFQDCSVFTLSSRRRASVAGLPRSGSWRLPTTNKVCFVLVCSVVSVAWNWLTTLILTFSGPKSFLFVFRMSGEFLVKYLLWMTVTLALVSTLKLIFLLWLWCPL